MIGRATRRAAPAVLIALLLGATSPAAAQTSLAFDVDIGSPLGPIATWSTTPAAAGCMTSWGGFADPSGTATLPPITGPVTYEVTCDWPGDDTAAISWTEPTQRTDGSTLTNLAETRLYWASDGSIGDLDAADCLLDAADRVVPAGTTATTVEGLVPATWEFVAFAVDQQGLCSAPSNMASKQTTAGASQTDSVTITVPSPVSGVEVN